MSGLQLHFSFYQSVDTGFLGGWLLCSGARGVRQAY